MKKLILTTCLLLAPSILFAETDWQKRYLEVDAKREALEIQNVRLQYEILNYKSKELLPRRAQRALDSYNENLKKEKKKK